MKAGVLLAVLLMAGAAYGMELSMQVQPEQPRAFQPFFTQNQPAKVVIEVRDASGRLVRDVWLDVRVEHVKGTFSGRLLHTGFPYLEGKEVLGGRFFSRDGRLELSYVFPIRGSYRVEVTASAGEERVSREFTVKVREQGYEVRNAVLLVLLMLGFGTALGVIFGRACVRVRR